MDSHMIQIVPKEPPGFGGVERIAHEIGNRTGWRTYCLEKIKINKNRVGGGRDKNYILTALKSIKIWKHEFPMVSREILSMLWSKNDIIAHLPSAGILAICITARIINRQRKITIYWHAFVEDNAEPLKTALRLYEFIAISFIRKVNKVITTSEDLADELKRQSIKCNRIHILPCCIGKELEEQSLSYGAKDTPINVLNIIFIGRLDGYKRVDLLIKAIKSAEIIATNNRISIHFSLTIVGEGPLRSKLEVDAKATKSSITFCGRVNEKKKIILLRNSDVLVLPAICSNEAFGIVQLEAMVNQVFPIAFKIKRSGASSVCDLGEYSSIRDEDDLTKALIKLARNKNHCTKLGQSAKLLYLELYSMDKWCNNFDKILSD